MKVVITQKFFIFIFVSIWDNECSLNLLWKVKSLFCTPQAYTLCVCSVMSGSLQPMDCSPPVSSVHGTDYPGKNSAVGCHFLLQGIFPTQESNPHLFYLLHWQVDPLWLSHLGSPNWYITVICAVNSITIKREKIIDKEKRQETHFLLF